MKLKAYNENIKIIRLSRNFGQTAAIYAGLNVFLIQNLIL